MGIYTRNHNLKIHSRKHGIQTIPRFKCNICKKEFDYRVQVTTHKYMHHGIGTNPNKYECPICGKYVHSLNRHLASHKKDKRVKCTFPKCKSTFKHITGLKKHRDQMHKEGVQYYCPSILCTHLTSFNARDKLKRHIRSVHLNRKVISCLRCKTPFGTITDFNIHMKSVHYVDVEWFECKHENCFELSTRKSAMTVHEKIDHSVDNILRRVKKEENKIVKLLNKYGISFVRELKIDYNCVEKISDMWKKNYANIDFVLHSAEYTILLEVDEKQHKFGYGGVSCDMKRMNFVLSSIRASGNNLPVLFLRYNPNNFKIDCKTCKVSDKVKHYQLLDFIEKYKPSTGNLEIKYLFYDTFSGSSIPDHCKSDEFHPEMRKCII